MARAIPSRDPARVTARIAVVSSSERSRIAWLPPGALPGLAPGPAAAGAPPTPASRARSSRSIVDIPSPPEPPERPRPPAAAPEEEEALELLRAKPAADVARCSPPPEELVLVIDASVALSSLASDARGPPGAVNVAREVPPWAPGIARDPGGKGSLPAVPWARARALFADGERRIPRCELIDPAAAGLDRGL